MTELDPHDYPHCEPCALGAHAECVGVLLVGSGCCCEAPAAAGES